jgi:mannose-6-phosphate isomerase-like protein (cupin superfamily)
LSERQIVCEDLSLAIDDLRRDGFRLDSIYPADDPRRATLSRAGESVLLTTPDAAALPEQLPSFESEFVLTRAGGTAGEGRAGMMYRDLIPSRLGGRYIASHITIPDGGPVADWVHFHRLAFQMILVRRGWVRVVYQDQGEPFVMNEGDFVLQPPEIRHRVLESSPGLEVVEISAPALHETLADHELSLPNRAQPGGIFAGQYFLHHIAAATPWSEFNGAEAQDTAMDKASSGIADLRVIRPGCAAKIDFAAHDGELVFGFVLDGRARLDYRGGFDLGPADAFAIPPGETFSLEQMSDDFRLLSLSTARLDAGA